MFSQEFMKFLMAYDANCSTESETEVSYQSGISIELIFAKRPVLIPIKVEETI